MPVCCAYGCKNRTQKGSKISFHELPVDQEIKKKWIHALRWENWTPTQYTSVCSDHFTPESYVSGLKIRKLKKDAIPTIFLHYPVHLQSIKPAPRRATKRSQQSDISVEPAEKKARHEGFLPAKMIVEIDHNYCKPSGEVLQVLFEQEVSKNQDLKRKLHNSIVKNKRLQKSCDDLLQVVAELKAKKMVGDQGLQLLQKAASEVPFELFSRLKNKLAQSIPPSEKYPHVLRRFALTLHFHSPKAYRFVRKEFDLALPHESVLRRWCMTVDGSPGFTEQSFKQLEARALDEARKNKRVIVHLTSDEMAIRKQVESGSGSLIGCVDLGPGFEPDDTTPFATEALVFMAVGVNSSWKLPLAYFFINSLTGEEKSSLINTCLNKLRDVNVHVTGLTVDGLSSNISMMEKLGCQIDWKSPQTNFFPSEHLDEPANIVFDPCHMIKLIRNAFADLKVLRTASGQEIRWKYIQLLHDLQVEEGVHVANKLRKAHVEFHCQKMKVCLATQVLSNSVADALRFCREELNLPQFAGSEGTEEFIRIFNDVFDIMNSKNLLGKNLKAPMSLSNETCWRSVFERTRDYILNLSLSDGLKVVDSRRKTGFVGMLMNMKALQNIFDLYVRKGHLSYLLTYKLSQDHLELFFGSVRSRLGCNNNPTTTQFKGAYKRLLVHGVMEGLNGNCFPQDDTQVLSHEIINSLEHDQESAIKAVRAKYDLIDYEWDHDYVTSLTNISKISEFQESVTEYIAGFVVRQVARTLSCEICCQAVMLQRREHSLKLVGLKDKGGLVKASDDVIKVCATAELCLQRIAKSCRGVAPFSKKLLAALSTTVLEIVHEKYR